MTQDAPATLATPVIEQVNEDSLVHSFTLLGEPHEAAVALKIKYASGGVVFVAFEHEDVWELSELLAASVQRCASRRGDKIEDVAANEPMQSRVVGDPVDIQALRVTDVDIDELEDGSGVVIDFEHPSCDDTTAVFPYELLRQLAPRVRGKAVLS